MHKQYNYYYFLFLDFFLRLKSAKESPYVKRKFSFLFMNFFTFNNLPAVLVYNPVLIALIFKLLNFFENFSNFSKLKPKNNKKSFIPCFL